MREAFGHDAVKAMQAKHDKHREARNVARRAYRATLRAYQRTSAS